MPCAQHSIRALSQSQAQGPRGPEAPTRVNSEVHTEEAPRLEVVDTQRPTHAEAWTSRSPKAQRPQPIGYKAKGTRPTAPEAPGLQPHEILDAQIWKKYPRLKPLTQNIFHASSVVCRLSSVVCCLSSVVCRL